MFTPPIFHPKVDPVSGCMETKSAFGKWEIGIHHIWHLILYIKKSFLIIDETNCVNQIAADLYGQPQAVFMKYLKLTIFCISYYRYTQHTSEFHKHILESIEECKEHLHDANMFSTDIHYLNFSSYNPNIHGTFRKVILANAKPNSTLKTKPLSWVKPGSLDPFSSERSWSYSS